MNEWDESTMEELVGRSVTGISVSRGESYLMVTTDHGPLAWKAVGDCCSETWFAEVLGVDCLIGQRVTKTEEREMPAWTDGKSRQDYDKIYGIALITERGLATVVFRNSSNGYYGGWITATDPRSSRDYREITTDWSA